MLSKKWFKLYSLKEYQVSICDKIILTNDVILEYINIYSRMNNYLFQYYFSIAINKVVICSAINNYGIKRFSFLD
jgi:hypothetical protein